MACCRAGDGGQLTQDSQDKGSGGGGTGRRRSGHCGLCSLVARAFRRAVCGAASRRGSGESYLELTGRPQDEDATVTVSKMSIIPFNSRCRENAATDS